MLNQYGDSTYWRTAAANARAMAETFDDEAAHDAMVKIAANLETIALRVYVQETGINIADKTQKTS